MSQVKIQGNASGTGIFTVAAPNSNTDRTLTLPDSAGTLDRLERAGNVLQVVSITKTDTFSSTSGGWIDVTGLSATITPLSTSSKILVMSDVGMGLSDFNNLNFAFKVLRNSTDIGISTSGTVNASGGANMYLLGGSVPYIFGNFKVFLDSPSSTSATTYKIQITKNDAGGTIYVNRRAASTDICGTSGITLVEIAG